MAKNTTKIVVTLGIIVALIGVLVLGVFVWKSNESRKKAEEIARLAAEREETENAYEAVLNGFVKNVATEIKAYKQQRLVLREMVRPHNFETPDFARLSYEEFKNQTRPALHKQAERVLSVFDISGAELDQVLEGRDPEAADFLRAKWQAMKAEQRPPYEAYFAREEKVLDAYEELLRFYFVKSKTLKVVEDEIVFSDPDDQAAMQDLRAIIADLQKSENTIDKKPEDSASQTSVGAKSTPPTLTPAQVLPRVPVLQEPSAPPPTPPVPGAP